MTSSGGRTFSFTSHISVGGAEISTRVKAKEQHTWLFSTPSLFFLFGERESTSACVWPGGGAEGENLQQNCCQLSQLRARSHNHDWYHDLSWNQGLVPEPSEPPRCPRQPFTFNCPGERAWLRAVARLGPRSLGWALRLLSFSDLHGLQNLICAPSCPVREEALASTSKVSSCLAAPVTSTASHFNSDVKY